jgi:hypothetical protein
VSESWEKWMRTTLFRATERHTNARDPAADLDRLLSSAKTYRDASLDARRASKRARAVPVTAKYGFKRWGDLPP